MSIITHGLPGTVIIGIDCAPGARRPGDYIKQVANKAGITDIPHPSSMFFGAWSWRFKNIEMSYWEQVKDEVVAECQKLYNSGEIRGAEHYWISALQDYIDNKKILGVSPFLMYLTVEDLYDVVDDNDEKDKFKNNFDYAKLLVDQVFDGDANNNKSPKTTP